MNAPTPVPVGVHFWWCQSRLRPHAPVCTCPPDRLRAAVEREREAALVEVAGFATTVIGEAK